MTATRNIDTDTTWADELSEVAQAHERSAAQTEELRQRRNALMFSAARDGKTQAQIARAAFLTRGRVGQIMMGREEPEA
jgi:hypothetical protein